MKKSTGFTIFGLLILVLLGFFVVSTNKGLDKSDAAKQSVIDDNIEKDITIAMMNVPGYSPFNIAEEEDLWTEGYDVTLVRIESFGDIRTAMNAGIVDMYLGTYEMFLNAGGSQSPGHAVLALSDSIRSEREIAVTDFLRVSDKMIAQGAPVNTVVKGWYDALAYIESNSEETKKLDEKIDRFDEEDNIRLFDKKNENNVYADYVSAQELLEKNGETMYPTNAEDVIIKSFISVE